MNATEVLTADAVPTAKIESIPGAGEPVKRQVLQFYSAKDLAAAMGCSRKTVHRQADAARWPKERAGNTFHYCVPAELAASVAAARPAPVRVPVEAPALAVTFADIAADADQAYKVGLRKQAVDILESLKDAGRELAIKITIDRMGAQHPDFQISARSLRTWTHAYSVYGLNGLVPQMKGIVGRRGVYVPPEFVALGKALTIERGSVAMAARELATHPDLPAGMRLFLHGGHSTKSYVTPSIARAISPAILTTELAQGPKEARLAGRWTPGDYSDCRAGDYFCSDDMTSNVLCWCEWPNAVGWRIGQAQILPVLDVRSLRWLNVRVVLRDGGQYNAQDDIWGLFGDVFDAFGLPHEGFVLEGGHWQAARITGVRTGLDADVRIGGLESLGLRNVRSFDPRSKIIEACFNTLQHHIDRMPGFAGRDQRRDMSEAMKQRVALLRVKNPLHHPREFFPHVSQLADQVKLSMENQNHEPQDGKLLRGMSPLELWAEHNPQLRSIPDSAKWLYRSAMNVSKVTSNGVRITRGSGPKMEVFYYDNPDFLVPLQGRQVIVYRNDSNPESDAILRLPMAGSAPKFLCVAKHVKPLMRFTATCQELNAETRRKRAALHYARTELRSIQPEFVRDTVPVPVDAEIVNMGERIADATARAKTAGEARQTSRLAGMDTTAGATAAVAIGREVKQKRGARAVIRAAVLGFAGAEFTLREIRAKLPGPLQPGAPIVLFELAEEGELVKARYADGRKTWKATAAFRTSVTRRPRPAPKAENLIDAGGAGGRGLPQG